jgi:hypothetical protein
MMASEIAPNSANSYSMGSLKLIIVSLTTSADGDTYTIEKYAPVVDYWTQSHVGTAGYSSDVSYDSATGIFTLTSAQQGLTSLFIVMKT